MWLATGCFAAAGLLLAGGYTLWRARRLVRALRGELAEAQRIVAEAQQLIERRGRLADELAHEVKNPLSAIVCSAEALELMGGKFLPPDQRRCLTLIREFSNHVLRLVGDFLDLSRVDGGRISPQLSSVDVRPVLDSLYDLVEPSAKRRGIRLSIEYPEESVTAHVDSLHLKQVLFNLIQNALRYTSSGGQVSLRAALHEDSSVAIQVSDTGVGIAPEHLDSIFEPYVSRPVKSNGTEDRGIGIGLSVCRALMELNGGTILVESHLGSGSTFSLVLPRGKELELRPRASTGEASIAFRSSSGAAQGQRVMVLSSPSDESSGPTCALLEAWGACVERVHDAAALVTKLGEASFDAVLVPAEAIDHLPGDLCETIHARGGRIVATAQNQITEARAKECGVDVVIASPITGDALRAALN